MCGQTSCELFQCLRETELVRVYSLHGANSANINHPVISLPNSVVQGAANQPPRGGNRGRFPPQLLAASRANFAAADYMQKISNVKFERFIFKYLCTFETGSMQFSYVTPHTAYKVFLR